MKKRIEIAPSALHELPKDIEKILISDDELLKKWNSLTPLARNEWICWITIVKKQETREDHITRLQEDLLKGKRRPCCWPGCPGFDSFIVKSLFSYPVGYPKR